MYSFLLIMHTWRWRIRKLLVTPLEIQNGQLGFSDYSTAFNTMFTEPIILEDYTEVVYKFTNYTQGPGNEKNWYLVFTNGKTRGQRGM